MLMSSGKGKGEAGLCASLPLSSLAVVEPAGVGIALNAGERGHVEEPLKSSVVSLRPVQIAAALPGSRRGAGGEAGEGRQTVRRGEVFDIATDANEKVSAEHGSELLYTRDFLALPNRRPNRRGDPGHRAQQSHGRQGTKATPGSTGCHNPTNGWGDPRRKVERHERHFRTRDRRSRGPQGLRRRSRGARG